MELKPGIKSEITAGALKSYLSILPEDTMLVLDLSDLVKERKEAPDERKKT